VAPYVPVTERGAVTHAARQAFQDMRERLKGILDREASDAPQATTHKLDGHTEPEQGSAPVPSIRERPDDVLNKPREKLTLRMIVMWNGTWTVAEGIACRINATCQIDIWTAA
jgi:hypothetical protein